MDIDHALVVRKVLTILKHSGVVNNLRLNLIQLQYYISWNVMLWWSFVDFINHA